MGSVDGEEKQATLKTVSGVEFGVGEQAENQKSGLNCWLMERDGVEKPAAGITPSLDWNQS